MVQQNIISYNIIYKQTVPLFTAKGDRKQNKGFVISANPLSANLNYSRHFFFFFQRK